MVISNKYIFDKRAQRTLSARGRLPGEKVKVHSGVIYKGPVMLYTKYKGCGRFYKKIARFPYLL